MNVEAKNLLLQLTEAIKRSQEYVQYHNLLESVKTHPDLYARIGEFRRQSIAIQLNQQEDFLAANEALRLQFEDLQANGLANEFLAAEHQYCHMIKEMQTLFLDSICLEINFLDE